MSAADETALSPVRGDALLRAQRAIGLAAILLPAALPLIGVLAIEISVKDLLLGLLKTLA